jgi:hypothetical protein
VVTLVTVASPPLMLWQLTMASKSGIGLMPRMLAGTAGLSARTRPRTCICRRPSLVRNPFLGHVVQLQRRPLALLDSPPAHGPPQPPVSQARHRAFARTIWYGVRQDTRMRSGLATMMARALAREVATFSRCGS